MDKEQDMYAVYELDFLRKKGAGNGDENVCRYWIHNSKIELRRLNGIPSTEITSEQQMLKHRLEVALSEIFDVENELGNMPPHSAR